MKKIIFSLIILISLVSVNLVFAVDAGSTGLPTAGSTGVPTAGSTGIDKPIANQNTPTPTLQNPLNASSIQEVILLAVDLAIYIGTAFAVLVLIFIGFKFVLAQGNPEKLKEARRWFLWVIVGLAILIISKVMVEIVKNTLIKAGVTKPEFFNNKFK